MYERKEYNGYVSWDAWVIQLWIDNEESIYKRYWALLVKVANSDKPVEYYKGRVMHFYREAREYARQQEHQYIRYGRGPKGEQADLWRHFCAELENEREYLISKD